MIDYFNALNDKVKHFLVSALLVVFFMFLYQDLTFTVLSFEFNDRFLSLLTVVFIGIVKELWDEYVGSSGFNYFDIFAGVAGIMAGFVSWHLLLWML